ncbi:MAG: hypothetical protein Q4D57_04435 [Clostridia bacterium]|nr:hypothetical protein [Clostridia bacterium]
MANKVEPSRYFYSRFVSRIVNEGALINFIPRSGTNSFAEGLCFDEPRPEYSYDPDEIEKITGIVGPTISNFYGKVFPAVSQLGGGTVWIMEFQNFAAQVGLLEFENVFENLNRNYLYDIAKILLFTKNYYFRTEGHLFKSIGYTINKENIDRIKNEYKIGISEDFPYSELVRVCTESDALIDLLCGDLEKGDTTLKNFREKYSAFNDSINLGSGNLFREYLKNYDKYIEEHGKLSDESLKAEPYSVKYNGEQAMPKKEDAAVEAKREEKPQKDEFEEMALDYAKCIAENLESYFAALEKYKPGLDDYANGMLKTGALTKLREAIPRFHYNLDDDFEDRFIVVPSKLDKIRNGNNASDDQKALASYLLGLSEYLQDCGYKFDLGNLPDIPEEPKGLTQYGTKILNDIKLVSGDKYEERLDNQLKDLKTLIEKKAKLTEEEAKKYSRLKGDIDSFEEEIKKCEKMISEKAKKHEVVTREDMKALEGKATSLKVNAKLLSAEYVLKLHSCVIKNTPGAIPDENDIDKFPEETEGKLREPVKSLGAAVKGYLGNLSDDQTKQIAYKNSELRNKMVVFDKQLSSETPKALGKDYVDGIKDCCIELGINNAETVKHISDTFTWINSMFTFIESKFPVEAFTDEILNFNLDESLFLGHSTLNLIYDDIKKLVDKVKEKVYTYIRKAKTEERTIKTEASVKSYESSSLKKLMNEANAMLSKKPAELVANKNINSDEIGKSCRNELGISNGSVIDHINNFFIWFSSLCALMSNKNSNAETFTAEIMNFTLDGELLSGNTTLNLIKIDLANLIHGMKKKVYEYKEAKRKEEKSINGRIKKTTKRISTKVNEKLKNVIPEWLREKKYLDEEEKHYNVSVLRRLFGVIISSINREAEGESGEYDLCEIFSESTKKISGGSMPLAVAFKSNAPYVAGIVYPSSAMGLSRAVSKAIKKNNTKVICLSERELLRIYILIGIYARGDKLNNPSNRRALVRYLKQEVSRLKVRSRVLSPFSNIYKMQVIEVIEYFVKVVETRLKK